MSGIRFTQGPPGYQVFDDGAFHALQNLCVAVEIDIIMHVSCVSFRACACVHVCCDGMYVCCDGMYAVMVYML